jgi:hypothetical protein
MRFDWYQGTVKDGSADEVLGGLLGVWDMSSVESIRGQNSYEQGARVYRGDSTLARVYWGGVNGEDPHVISSSDSSPEVAQHLRAWHPEHHVTRIDVCEDYCGDGTWDLMYDGLTALASRHRIRTSIIGDYIEAQHGRTLYLGAPSSVVRCRLYEKGHESGHQDKTWVRLELQVKPKRVEAREYLAKAEPQAAFGCSGWSNELFGYLSDADIARIRAGSLYAPSDDERAYKHMIKQYGPLLTRLAASEGVEAVLGKLRRDLFASVGLYKPD